MLGVYSSRLKERKEEIMSRWTQRALAEVSSAKTGATLALRDSVPTYLDHLCEALATNRRMDFRSVAAHDDAATRISRMHGADRASNRSYLLTEVIFEYHLLREVIFQVLEREGPLEQSPRDIILDSVEQAVNDAAVEFSEVHADIQQKFINTLTHDLKTPISSAKMNAEMILRRSDTSADSASYARKAVGSLNRLNSMIHDLLDASLVRAGERLSLQFIECDLDVVIREVLEEMKSIHGERFILNTKEPLSGTWGCDGLRRAFENIINNAVKYGAPDSPITVSLIRNETGIEVSVHNEGTPIPENEIPLLFQQYRRSQSAQTGRQTGWGLGLTLVKGVVDAHQGMIRVMSAPGKGTTFILEVPFVESTIADNAMKKAENS